MHLAHGQGKKAIRLFEKAMTLEAQRRHDLAKRKMQLAVREFPAYTEALSTLGGWYQRDRQWKEAIAIWQQACRNTPGGYKAFALPLARSLHQAGRPAEALAIIGQYGSGTAVWEELRQQALLLQQMQGLRRAEPVHMLSRVNTTDAELFPWLSGNGQQLSLTRRVNGVDEDFFRADTDSCGGWFAPKNLGSPPNTLAQESAQMISADGHYLFFSRCENRMVQGWDGGGCDLYLAYRVDADSPWTVEQNFGATINSPAFEGMPCLSADNRELFFVSDRPGGQGGLDIWVSRFDNGRWQEPRNLGPEVNTPRADMAPYLHTDNRSLYFSSDGHPSVGGNDIYLTRRKDGGEWTKPEILPYPINTPANEMGICISTSGATAIFASDRSGITGDFDLFETTLTGGMRPDPVQMISGYVFDSITRARLTIANIFLTDVSTNQTVYQVQTNRGDGTYAIPLIAGREYQLKTDRIGYQERVDTLKIPAGDTLSVQKMHIALLPDDYVAPVHDSLLLTICFPLNAARLTDADRMRLQQTMAPWMDHLPGTIFFINGYTDNSGTPMINEQLSFSRARLLARELISLGVDEMNVKIMGWGEAAPVAPNDTEENRAKNRRVELIIRR